MTIPSPQDVVLAFLADPATHNGQAVERIDTHISTVFLSGDRAWKVKKAVTLPFLDFATCAMRHDACQAEVSLNRRTAPDLYLDVIPVTRNGNGDLMLGGIGEPVEWVIEMRRFPQDMLLSAVARREGGLSYNMLLDMAEAISRFHSNAEIFPGRFGSKGVMSILDRNHKATTPHCESGTGTPVLDPDSVSDLFGQLMTEVRQLSPLLDARSHSGQVRRCHGDLHLGNICLSENKTMLFDCIEFNELFSTIDVLYDLAFLMMDLLHCGYKPEASILLNAYLEWRNDLDGLAALPLFIAIRAQIRSFISASIAPHQSSPVAMQEQARIYHREALAALQRPTPMIIAVGGLSGSGKSRCARHLAPHLGGAFGGIVLRTDVIRKRILDHDPYEHLPPSAYTGEMSRKTYDTLYDDCRRVIADGLPVLADAVFAKQEERERIEALAHELGVPFIGLWLEADPEIAATRIENRKRTPSDATVEVLHKQLAWNVGEVRWTRIDSSGSKEVTDAIALDAVRAGTSGLRANKVVTMSGTRKG
ncbi:AAA family ATPase [Haematospirillum sp. 15-248]|uniref:bifunctional aminoglycoside phosphotransferase/ATP-binding protein n=1 Tax=Haematospirillum sp. 15-248 TaxID=2723107 RepID=UPI0014392691|nr:bifunctional aminoglycoside phosphotransferase/ATP-binding protein [Haematospirillum sp. 15-248]NKD87406.1 AAA family ATPase [Haematospirillum sp. 15-248]